jgi:hypothetical protein
MIHLEKNSNSDNICRVMREGNDKSTIDSYDVSYNVKAITLYVFRI